MIFGWAIRPQAVDARVTTLSANQRCIRAMKVPTQMKFFISKFIAVSACLSFSLVFAAQTPAKPKENASFDAGIAAYQANNLPLAYKKFLAAAKEGHADSQFNVGLMYEKGIGTAKSEKEAIVWYGKSAAQGNAAAQYNLGVLYENGLGTPVDYASANKWYRRAAAQGDALAIGNLGMLYVRGQGVKEDKVVGVALLMVSATKDPSPDNHAKSNLASTRGLSTKTVTDAQALSGELGRAPNLLVPLDQYLKKIVSGAGKK